MRYVGLVVLVVSLVAMSSGCGGGSASAQTEDVITELPVSNVAVERLTSLETGRVVFEGFTPEFGVELWGSDGTSTGTALIADIRNGSSSGLGHYFGFKPTFIVLNGEAFFFADDGINGREVWRTDGTPAGTELLADLIDGPSGFDGDVSEIVADGNRLLIIGADENNLTATVLFVFEPGN